MVKRIAYTKITPLPSNIPRQLALHLLHSHEEFMQLNKLVTNVRPIEPPQEASADEFFGEWLEITQRITFLPGVNKKIVFKGCFYNQPWGLENHTIYSSLLEMRSAYRIGGNQPGEPREGRELGVNKPEDGLYLREDVKIDVFVPFAGPFVKKEMQNTSAMMISRLKRKAELLDEGRLLAMFEDGKLKTTRADSAAVFDERSAGIASPSFQRSGTFQALNGSSAVSRPSSRDPGASVPTYQQNEQLGLPLPQSAMHNQTWFISELPEGNGQQGFRSELPGDTIVQPATRITEG